MPMGITSKSYVNMGTFLVPNWEEIKLIGDLTPNLSWNLGDGSVRVPRVVQQEPTNLVIEVTGRVRKNMSNVSFLKLRGAFLACTIVDVMILDGLKEVNNHEGVRCEFKVSAFNEPQGLQEVTFKEFTLTPCISDNHPMSVIVIAGAPSFSPIDPPALAP